MENFLSHNHEPLQTGLLVCWDIKNERKLIKQDFLYKTEFPYRFKLKFADEIFMDVLVLSRIRGITVSKRA